MKALTFTEPWAMMAALSEKEWETRSWPTSYRGELAIHAALTFPRYARDLCWYGHGPFFAAFIKHRLYRWQDLPLGAIVGVCDLVACEPGYKFRRNDQELSADQIGISEQELAFGLFWPNIYSSHVGEAHRYAFKMANARRLKVPIPCKGALKLWEVPQEVEAQIIAQLTEGG